MMKNISKRRLTFLAMLFSLIFTFSCTNDEPQNNVPENIVSANKTRALSHKLNFVNNSSYDYAICTVGAQTNYLLLDPMSIAHKNEVPFILKSNQKVTFFDYKNVTDDAFAINSWHVVNTNLHNGDLGYFTSDEMTKLYGMPTIPNDPGSKKYPVWKLIQGRVLDKFGQTLSVLWGNNPGRSLANLGNIDQGYNSILKYGNSDFSESKNANKKVQPLVVVTWRQQNEGALRNTGEITITIENLRFR